MTEEWREIPDWEGAYEVSNLGRIRSMDRMSKNGNKVCHRKSKIRSLSPSGPGGYLGCLLTANGKKRTYMKAHIAVLRAFVGPRPLNYDGCHNDGNTNNNRLDNLRWDSKSNNNQDKKRHGTEQKGSRIGTSKLNEVEVKEIRNKIENGKTLSELAREYQISVTTIWNIKNRTLWKHI